MINSKAYFKFVKICLVILVSCIDIDFGTKILLGCDEDEWSAGNGAIYTADTDSNSDNMGQLNFVKIATFVVNAPFGITQDPATRDIYAALYEADGTGKIVKVSEDGMESTTILDSLTKPRGICLNDNYLYWVEDKDDEIHRVGKDGVGDTVIQNTDTPWGIACDSIDSHLYWGQHWVGKVHQSDFDGNNAKEIIDVGDGLNDVIRGLAIDQTERKLYIAVENFISKYDLQSDTPVATYLDGVTYEIYDVTVYDKLVLYVARKIGLLAVTATGGDQVALDVQGLDACWKFYSVHVMGVSGTVVETTPKPEPAPVTPTPEPAPVTPTPEPAPVTPATEPAPEIPTKSTANLPSTIITTSTHPTTTLSTTPVHPISTLGEITRRTPARIPTDPSATKTADTTKHTPAEIPTDLSFNTVKTSPGDATVTSQEHPEGSDAMTRSTSSLGTTKTPTSKHSSTVMDVKEAVDIYREFSGQIRTKELSNVETLLSAFEYISSIFPANAQFGEIFDSDYLRVYLYQQGTKEEYLLTEEDFIVIGIRIPFTFLSSAPDVGTGYHTILVQKQTQDFTVTESAQQVENSENVFMLGSDLVSINNFDEDGNLRNYENLQESFNITFYVQAPQPNYTGVYCAFWKDLKRVWSLEGSFTYDAAGEEQLYQRTCGFNHLTTFAVLFEFGSASKITNVYSYAVKVLVAIFILMSMSTLVVGLLIVTFLWVRTNVDNQILLIHTNLMIAMLLAYVLTLSSNWAKPKQNAACLALAILRYDMFVSGFCCMLVEGLHLYRMLVIVFGSDRDLKVLYTLIGFGLPMLITTITASIGRGDLHSNETCWLTGQFVWAFIGPVLAILTTNVVILVIVLYKTLTVAAADDDSRIRSVKIGLRCTFLLLPMLGISWILGPLGNLHINVVYVFDVLSALQGVYLVVVTCYVNSEVRETLKREWNRARGRVGLANDHSMHAVPADVSTSKPTLATVDG